MVKVLKKIILVITALAILASGPLEVMAQEPSPQPTDDSGNTGVEEKNRSDLYTENEVLFYDPTGCSTSSGPTNATAGGNIPSGYKAPKQLLDDAAKHKDVYQQVSQETGVPAAIFAVIHYRESSFGLRWPGNGQGIYQFYPDTHYPRSGSASKDEFLEQTRLVFTKKLKSKMQLAAAKLKELGHQAPQYNINDKNSVAAALKSEDFLKAVLFAYNGWASTYAKQANDLGFQKKPWEGSPYVMNLWDSARNGSEATKRWGQIKTDGGSIEYPANDAVGAFTLYIALGGAVDGSGICETGGGGGLADVVRIAREEYAKNVREYDSNVLKYTRGNEYAWCAAFVSWVFKEAGVPFSGGQPSYYYPGVVNLSNWFKKEQEFFKPGEKDPQPGDVAFYIGAQTPDGGSTEHVNIVISYEKSSNKMVTIGGNESDALRQSTRPVKIGAHSLAGFGRKVK